MAAYSKPAGSTDVYWEQNIGDMWGLTYGGQRFFISGTVGSVILKRGVDLSNAATEMAVLFLNNNSDC